MSQKKAFTLIEMLVVIAIIAILAGFITIKINDSINAGKDAKRQADIELLANSLITYSSDNYSNKPTTGATACIIGGGCSEAINDTFKTSLPELPTDPNSGNFYTYKNDGSICEIVAYLSTGGTYKYNCITNEASPVPIVSGACGTTRANTPATGFASSTEDWPQGAYCNSGTSNPGDSTLDSAFPDQGESVSWDCVGDYKGTVASCNAYRAKDGTCGTADYRTPKVYADADTSYGTDTICGFGTATPLSPGFPAKGAATTWTCAGINNGTTASCEARHTANGVCGTVTRTTATAYATDTSDWPQGSHCAQGTAVPTSPAFPGQGGSTTWSCNGIYGGTNITTCKAYRSNDGDCGTADAHVFADADTSYGTYSICTAGTASPASPAFPAKGGSTPWTCLKTYNGADASCSATRSLNGVCGTAAKAYASGDTAYSGTICATGTAVPASPAFPAQGGSTTWACNGSGGGTNASCTATRQVCGVMPACHSANYVASNSSMVVCGSGTTSNVSSTGSLVDPFNRVSWTYTCTGTGCYSGSSVNCTMSYGHTSCPQTLRYPDGNYAAELNAMDNYGYYVVCWYCNGCHGSFSGFQHAYDTYLDINDCDGSVEKCL